MLLLHEVHTLVGPKKDEFEASVRDEFMLFDPNAAPRTGIRCSSGIPPELSVCDS